MSVILPTRNRAGVLPRAMRSVLAQTHADLELIVVDDGSTDDTENVVKACTDRRIRYQRGRGGEGPAGARNRGIASSTGDFIAFQDSDDEWLTTKLEQQLQLLQSSAQLGLALCNYILVEGGSARLVACDGLVAGSEYESALLTGHPLATPAWLVRREVLQRSGLFDTALPSLEDWDLGLRLHGLCGLKSVAEPLLVKHGHADSVSADPHRHLRGLQGIHRRHQRLWQAHPAREAALLAAIGRLQCRFGQRRAGLESLARSVALAPGTPSHYWALGAALLGRSALRQLTRRLGDPVRHE